MTVATAPSTTPETRYARQRAALDLLADAQDVLERACTTPDPSARVDLAQVAVVRAASAVLALRDRPARAVRSLRVPGRQRTVWEVLARRAPELGEWATYFAVPVGWHGEACPDRVAADRVRDAERFSAAVERMVGRVDGAVDAR